ncbi:MAG: PEP-CTERM system TPR-repeat protein PrsT [Burkholderiaceae bacterium]|nr:PEP-CTERM system TPR-repeat protein PrsT [Burkholderiaceae bacterium]
MKTTLAHLAALAVAASLVACGKPTTDDFQRQATELAAKGDHAGAIVAAKAALADGQDSAELRWRLGSSLLQTRQGVAAIQELRKALDLGHDREQVIPALARAHLLAGQPEAVTRGLANPPLGSPKAAAALAAAVAEAWSILRDSPKMQQSLEQALQLDPQQPDALRLKARVVGMQGDVAAAQAIVDELVARQPRDAEALQLRGEIQRLKGEGAAASASFSQALEANPALVEARVHLISQHLLNKDSAAGRAELDRMRQSLPVHPLTVYTEAQVLFGEGQLAEARGLTQRLLRVSPDSVNLLHLAGVIEAQSGSLLLARSHLRRASQIEPENTAVRRHLAMVHLRLGQPQVASAALADLIAQPKVDTPTLTLAGRAAMARDDLPAAERLLARALEQTPGDRDARMVRALATLRTAQGAERGLAELQALSASAADTEPDRVLVGFLLARRQWEPALAAIDKALAKAPRDPALHELKGRVHAAQKSYPQARRALEQALELDPRHFAAIVALAQIDLVQKQPVQAVERVRAAAKADPRNTAAALALYRLLAASGASADELKETLAGAIRANPTDPGLRGALIDDHLLGKRGLEALAAAQEATSVMAGDVSLLDALGRAQQATGSTEQALATFKRAASLDPSSAVPHSRLADLAIAERDPKQAEGHLKRALELSPELGALQTRLVALLAGSGRAGDALGLARQWQLSSPKRANGFLLEGALHEREGAIDKALVAYRAAAEREPRRADVVGALNRAVAAQRSAGRVTGGSPPADAAPGSGLTALVSYRARDLRVDTLGIVAAKGGVDPKEGAAWTLGPVMAGNAGFATDEESDDAGPAADITASQASWFVNGSLIGTQDILVVGISGEPMALSAAQFAMLESDSRLLRTEFNIAAQRDPSPELRSQVVSQSTNNKGPTVTASGPECEVLTSESWFDRAWARLRAIACKLWACRRPCAG